MCGKHYQVVIGEVRDVAGLDTEIFECLGCGVNNLVQELTLNLVCRQCMPPKRPVQNAGNGLENGFRHVDMPPLFEDFLIDHGGNLTQAVLLGSVQLKRLTDS